MEQKEQKNTSYSVPIAIVVAGAKLAPAITQKTADSPPHSFNY